MIAFEGSWDGSNGENVICENQFLVVPNKTTKIASAHLGWIPTKWVSMGELERNAEAGILRGLWGESRAAVLRKLLKKLPRSLI